MRGGLVSRLVSSSPRPAISFERVRAGLLATTDFDAGTQLMGAERTAVDEDLRRAIEQLGDGEELTTLERHPRLARRVEHHRRLALAFGFRRIKIPKHDTVIATASFGHDQRMSCMICSRLSSSGVFPNSGRFCQPTTF